MNTKYSSNSPRNDRGFQQPKFLCKSANGIPVYDRPNSHHHLPDALLHEALARSELTGDFEKTTIQYPKPVGVSECVQTSSEDFIFYAQREGRNGLTRFVLDRKPEPCSSVVIICKRIEVMQKPGYLLVTAFVGSESEPEPWDPRATAAAYDYWNGHALIWNSAPVKPETLTAICPWSASAPLQL